MNTTADGCVFCRIATERAPATFVRRWNDAVAIVPLNPVVAGHLLVLPTVHVPHAATDPALSAAVMRRAAELAASIGEANLVTSIGASATQTVEHLHIHLVPRNSQDGLLLPWSTQLAPSRWRADTRGAIRQAAARLGHHLA